MCDSGLERFLKIGYRIAISHPEIIQKGGIDYSLIWSDDNYRVLCVMRIQSTSCFGIERSLFGRKILVHVSAERIPCNSGFIESILECRIPVVHVRGTRPAVVNKRKDSQSLAFVRFV